MNFSDLPDSTYCFPQVLANTDLHPDIVLFSQSRKEAVLLELTVCYEENFANAQNRKSAAYLELATTIEQNGYNVQLITLEVGSLGFICIDGFLELHKFLYISKAKWRQPLCAASAAAIYGSYRIWTSRNHSPT